MKLRPPSAFWPDDPVLGRRADSRDDPGEEDGGDGGGSGTDGDGGEAGASDDGNGGDDGKDGSDDGKDGSDDGKDGSDGGDGRAGDDGGAAEITTVETVVMAVSVVLTVALLGYLAWQAATTPAVATPETRVVETRQIEDGGLRVTVEVVNPGGAGVLEATAAVDCGESPPTVEFAYLPADGHRRAVVVCPAGTTDPGARLVSWVPA